MALDPLLQLENLLSGDAPLSERVYQSILLSCKKRKSIYQARQIHSHLAIHGILFSPVLGNYLTATLAVCGALPEALHVFHRLPCHTSHSWSAIISASLDRGLFQDVLSMYNSMTTEGLQPNEYVFPSFFRACAAVASLERGKVLHLDAVKKGFTADTVVCNSIITMYGKCGSLADAECVFELMPERAVISWNAMIGGYLDHGYEKQALLLYRQMIAERMTPNQHTFATALLAPDLILEKEEYYSKLGHSAKALCLEIGQAIHADARVKGFAKDDFLNTALLNMYSKCGLINNAMAIFGVLSRCDVISWSALLYTFLEQGQGEDVLKLYKQMHIEGVKPDQHTFVIVLQACAVLAEKENPTVKEDQAIRAMTLNIVQALHQDALVRGHACDVFVSNSLINAYGKCGYVVKAEDVFLEMRTRDLVSYTVMLLSYIEQGQEYEAFQFYRYMRQEGVKINDVNLICLLQACSQTGSLEMCRELHFAIICAEYDFNDRLLTTLISTYGSCSEMVDGYVVFDGLLNPDVVLWSACLAGYSGEANSSATWRMFEAMHLSGVQPDDATFASLISLCSRAGLIPYGFDCFVSMNRVYGITPDIKHYGTMIDVLARAGDFKRIVSLMRQMPTPPDFNTWICLLSACRIHGNVELGTHAFEHAVRLQPQHTTSYSLLSNISSGATWRAVLMV